MIKAELPKKIFAGAILVLVGANFFVWYAAAAESRGGILTLAVLDVGQGDAIYIEAPNGVQVIFDGGPDGSIITALREVMPFYDRTVDAVFVTNPDKDHFAGFIDLFNDFGVLSVFESGTRNDTEVFEIFNRAATTETPERRLVRRGQRIILDSDFQVFIDILFPDRDVSGLSPNDGSIVAKLVYKETCAILTGDAPSAIENYLIWLDREALDCEALKIGHHGSKTSTSPEFVAAVSPDFALISAGKENKYGHPHKETIQTLENFGTAIFSTDQAGTIILKSNGDDWSLANQ